MDAKKILIAFLIVLILGISGYSIWKNYFFLAPVFSPAPENQISPEDARDNQRIADLNILRKSIELYMKDYGGRFPVAISGEKISDDESNVFKTLKAGGYLEKSLKDSLPDKYYGYKSDGFDYELTAVLENKANGKCIMSGDLCLYKIQVADEFLFREEEDLEESMVGE